MGCKSQRCHGLVRTSQTRILVTHSHCKMRPTSGDRRRVAPQGLRVVARAGRRGRPRAHAGERSAADRAGGLRRRAADRRRRTSIPGEYGEADRHPTVELDQVRDDYELALARLAIAARRAAARDLPRRAGAQRRRRRHADSGHPELAAERPRAHRSRSATRSRTTSSSSPTRACRCCWPPELEDGRVAVNSRHHQSVKTPAPGFVVSATAPDGVVEAIEKTGRRLLPRRAVAPGELLADRPVLDAVRRPRRRGAPPGRSPPSRLARVRTLTDRTPRASPRARVFGNKSNASIDVIE